MNIIPKDVININQNFKSKKEALDYMAQNLEDKGYVSDKDVFLKDILAREAETSTNIGSGIAIPHARCCSVIRPVIAYVRNSKSISWSSYEEQGVCNIFMFAFSDDILSRNHYLSVLRDIASILSSPEKIEALNNFQTVEEFMEIMDVKKLP